MEVGENGWQQKIYVKDQEVKEFFLMLWGWDRERFNFQLKWECGMFGKRRMDDKSKHTYKEMTMLVDAKQKRLMCS